ncbi:MAG: glycosyltransferase [Phormidesmis sp.]
MPTVSVIIPAYNCQQYIAEAIESALTQAALEVIVIDDGSTDSTHEIIKAIASPHLHYVYQPNLGVCSARNHGIRLAKGELIAFLDADDWYLPHKLARQAALFAADAGLGMVQSGWQRVDESGQLLAAVEPWQTIPELSLANWLRFKPVLPSALMIRKDWLVRVGGFDPAFQAAEDVELVTRLAAKGCTAAWLPEVAVSYRQRSHSAMGNGLVQARDLAKFLDKFFGQPDLPQTACLLEKSVRYHTLVWAAWYLQHTGYLPQMAQYLKRAWPYSPYLPVETLVHWTESFTSFADDAGQPIDLAGLMRSPHWQALISWLLSSAAQSPKP